MNKQEIRLKVEQKLAEIQEKRVHISTELAEKEHHAECKYECCGSHNDYFPEHDKCPDCGMTEEIQDQHNNQWWSIVDDVESNDEQCSNYCEIEELLEEWLKKNNE